MIKTTKMMISGMMLVKIMMMMTIKSKEMIKTMMKTTMIMKMIKMMIKTTMMMKIAMIVKTFN